MTEPNLVHVGTSEVHAVRFFKEDVERPEWTLDDEDTGTINIQQWDADHVMTHVSVSTVGEQHAVRVRVSALFKELGTWTDLPEEQKQEAAQQMMTEMLPFLRQAVYNASSQVWPVKPIILDMRPASNQLGSLSANSEDAEVPAGK